MQNINLDTIKKYGIYAVIAIIIVITLVFIYKITKKFLTNELNAAQQEHINSKEIDTKEITIPRSELNNLVAKLKTAFGSYGYATDEKMVYSVFETLNSRSDVLALANAFGIVDDHTLAEWMNKELTNSELEHVQEILSSKGIVYQF